MNFKHIFIVTYGRTGSTLLQGLLNSIDGYCIRGENFNFCFGLFQSYQAAKRLKSEQGSAKLTTQPFYGAHLFNLEVLKQSLYELTKNQLSVCDDSIRCWGFKEVRYTPKELDGHWDSTLKDYLSFINDVFPNSAFVFLTRDHEKVLKSGFWSQADKDNALNNITFFEKESKAWSRNKENCYWIAYEDIVNTNSRLEGLYSFLGEQYDKENILKTLSIEHSYAGKKENLSKTIHSQKTNKVKKITPKQVESKIVQHAFIDKEVNLSFKDNEELTLGGVVLLGEKENIKAAKIVLSTGDIKHEAEWNLPSPVVSELFPENKYSNQSRFKLEKVKLNLSSKIFLEIENKEPILIFEFYEK